VDLRRLADAVEVPLYVRTRASRPGVGGERDGALIVRVAAPPSEGRANAEVESALARALGVRPAAISLISGLRGRQKRARVSGDPEILAADLAVLAASEPGAGR